MVQDPHLLVRRISTISTCCGDMSSTVEMGNNSIRDGIVNVRRDSGRNLRRHSARGEGDEEIGSVSNEGTLLGNQQPSYPKRESAILFFSLDTPILISNPQP